VTAAERPERRGPVVIARSDKGGYSYVERNVCHAYECPAWRIGKKSGPCNCGAEELFPTVAEAIAALEAGS